MPFPDGGARVRVSLDGGVQPTWKGDTSELYFLSPTGTMMAAGVRAADGLEVSSISRLFDTGMPPSAQNDQYRVTGDGQRFLVLQPAEGQSTRLRVIINWRERFKVEQAAGH